MKNDPVRNMNMPIKTGPNDPIPDAWTDNILGWLAYGATQSTQKQVPYSTLLQLSLFVLN